MNKFCCCGRLTIDPEVRTTTGDKPTTIARFGLAVNRKIKREGQPDADFFNCIAFNKQAEFAEKYLHKGTKVLLSGRLENDNYKNKDGQMVYSIQISVEEIEFAESKKSEEGVQGNYDFMKVADGAEEQLPFN